MREMSEKRSGLSISPCPDLLFHLLYKSVCVVKMLSKYRLTITKMYENEQIRTPTLF